MFDTPKLAKTAQTRAGASVGVHLYDLSEALAPINSVAIDIIGFGGALHVGVEVFGIEWSFGTGGVSCSMPKQNRHYVYRQTVHMGDTLLASEEVEQAIQAMQAEWPGSDYDLFLKNCGTFSNALCIRLGVGSLPPWVTRLAEAGGRSTTVRRIADMMARNGLIGEASPEPSVKGDASTPLAGFYDDTTPLASGYDDVTPQKQSSGLEELLWLSRMHGENWLEEEVDGDVQVPPQPPSAVSSNHPIGLRRSQSVSAEHLPSPTRASSMTYQPRGGSFGNGSFRINSYSQATAPLRAMTFDDGIRKNLSFCDKKFPFCAHASYNNHSSFMVVANGGG